MRGTVSLQSIVYKSKGFIKRKAPTILTCVGAAGVVATSVLTAKATVKAVDILKKAEEEKGEKLTKKEAIKVAYPVYIPPVITGVLTITSIFSANTINLKRQAALVNAYGVLDKSYKEYKEKVNELYGEDADANVRNEMAKDKYPVEQTKPESDETLLFFDEYANRWFWKTMQEVKDAEYIFNRYFVLRGYVELNDLYSCLGLEPTPFGATVGWSQYAGEATYGYMWIDFYHEKHESNDPDNPYYYTIYMPYHPTPDFMDY